MKRTALANGNSRSSIARGKTRRRSHLAVCVDNRQYEASLVLLKLYRVLPGKGLAPGTLRVVDESGEDYVYPAKRFVEIPVPPRVKRVAAAN